jgi:hypothetical protein
MQMEMAVPGPTITNLAEGFDCGRIVSGVSIISCIGRPRPLQVGSPSLAGVSGRGAVKRPFDEACLDNAGEETDGPDSRPFLEQVPNSQTRRAHNARALPHPLLKYP